MPDFDDWIDAQLRNVPVPRNLHARLRNTGAADGNKPSASRASHTPSVDDLADDGRLDAVLRDVEIPSDLHQRLRAIPREDRWPRSGIWAAAASILILLGGGAYWAVRPGTSDVPSETVASLPPAPVAPTKKPAQVPTRPLAQANKVASPQEPVTVRLGQESPAKSPNLLTSVAGVGSSLRQALETQRRTQSALGAGDRIEPLPALETLERPVARGVSPPLVRGYDLLFQLKHNEHPFVLPSAHASLRVSRVPFTFRTASYDQAARSVAAGRLPATNDVRVEDFLAAQNYVLPPAPPAKVMLDVAGCPSPLGEAGPQMLQVLVQGGSVALPQHPPTRLVAVVDTSSEMQTGARLETLRRALAKLATRMSGEDRVTLIGFSESPTVLAEAATRPELEALLESGKWARLSGKADITAAIRAAQDVVASLPAEQARRVLFVTAASVPDAQRQTEVQDALAQLAKSGAAWQVVRLSSDPSETAWTDLAKKSGGKASNADSADELAAAAREHWTGHSTVVARAVSLRIAFNPKAVASYRLLGHEAVTLTGDAGDPLKIDLRADQAATCMYELWLKPSGEGDLGTSELVWHDPSNGTPHRELQPIRREHLSPAFENSPAWLQQGVMAARAAEFLRGSYYVPNSRRLAQLLEVANRADASVFKSNDYRDLLKMIEQASRLR